LKSTSSVSYLYPIELKIYCGSLSPTRVSNCSILGGFVTTSLNDLPETIDPGPFLGGNNASPIGCFSSSCSGCYNRFMLTCFTDLDCDCDSGIKISRFKIVLCDWALD
jgi:hypothetical protein